MTDTNSVLCSWQIEPPRLRATFGRQALPMVWDYSEANPFGGAAGDYRRCIASLSEVLVNFYPISPGEVFLLSATDAKQSKGSVFSTDPPYYDNVPYADLSDFFYIWLRRPLRDVFPHEFATLLVPQKNHELVAEPFRHGGRDEAEEARAYNGLIVAWPELVKIAEALPEEATTGPAQAELAV